jgi:Lon protease-like protein
MSRCLPIFPLGTVLVPTQVLPLHIFEPRYRVLMDRLTAPETVPELGVVLIERGHEVGGGDQRVDTGTVARMVRAQQFPDGRWLAAVVGTTRFHVTQWRDDDPYPQAEVEDLPEPEWDPLDDDQLVAAEAVVREAVALAAELDAAAVPAGFELSDDPALRVWQLCALAPLGPFDRQQLLEQSRSVRLSTLVAAAQDAKRMLAFRLGAG